MEPFIKEFMPHSESELIGQDTATKQLVAFVETYRTQKKKAMILYGPAGVGKTSAVYAVATKRNLEVVEVNASDIRNADAITSLLGGALGQQSLFSAGKIILVDEIDGLAGNKDRGGAQAVAKLLKASTFPIVLTATDPYINKLSSLRSKSTLVEFNLLDYKEILLILETICQKKNISYDSEALVSLARRAGGDARAAINNLHTLSLLSKKLGKEDVSILDDRDKTENIMTALNKIYKTTSLDVALPAFDTVKEDVNDRLLWLDENTHSEYTKPKDLARAYDAMSRADVFNSRIRRWQHWRFLVYVNALLSGGIATAKDEKYKSFVQYKPTGRILKLWWAKQKSFKKKAIAEKIAAHTHSSNSQVLKTVMPYFVHNFKRNKAFAAQSIEQLELDKDQIEWLNKQKL